MNVGDKFSLASPPVRKDTWVPAIYKITNTVNQKIYIGSTKFFYNRFSNYKSIKGESVASGRLLVAAISKYGLEKFEFEIVEIPTEENRFDREQYWIDLLKPFTPIGYNLAKNAIQIPYVKKSALDKEGYREKRRKIALKYSEQTKERSSRPVYRINKETLEIEGEYPSALEADRILNISENSVNKVCRDVKSNNTAAGSYWSYKDDYHAGKFVAPQKRKIRLCASFYIDIKPVEQRDLSGNLIKIWDCAKDIKDNLGFCPGVIYKSCRGERGNCYGFKWSYVVDESVLSEIRERRKAHYEANKFENLE
jgi:group I intron endonuclease